MKCTFINIVACLSIINLTIVSIVTFMLVGYVLQYEGDYANPGFKYMLTVYQQTIYAEKIIIPLIFAAVIQDVFLKYYIQKWKVYIAK